MSPVAFWLAALANSPLGLGRKLANTESYVAGREETSGDCGGSRMQIRR